MAKLDMVRFDHGIGIDEAAKFADMSHDEFVAWEKSTDSKSKDPLVQIMLGFYESYKIKTKCSCESGVNRLLAAVALQAVHDMKSDWAKIDKERERKSQLAKEARDLFDQLVAKEKQEEREEIRMKLHDLADKSERAEGVINHAKNDIQSCMSFFTQTMMGSYFCEIYGIDAKCLITAVRDTYVEEKKKKEEKDE